LDLGSRHPINLVKNRIIEIFKSIGFAVADGPEIEDDWHNFTALNLPEYHPARDMQDTFFIEQNPDILLRTHTSSVQIRYMEENQPPSEFYLREEYSEMKRFLHVLTVFSIRLKDYILMRM
jgi:phenylalanyl-tRNA synthetase alpha chain